MTSSSPDLLVRVLLFAGWGFGLVSLLDPDRMPFTAFAIVAGTLLTAAGIALVSDGGRAMARLNERYAPWQRVPPHRWMGGLLIAIGAIWAVLGLAAALG